MVNEDLVNGAKMNMNIHNGSKYHLFIINLKDKLIFVLEQRYKDSLKKGMHLCTMTRNS